MLQVGALLAALTSSLLGACLVTTDIEFGEKDLPPVAKAVEPNVPVLRARPTEPGDEECVGITAPGAPEDAPRMKFVVDVTEPNIGDPLEARLFLNGQALVGTPDPLPASTSYAPRRVVLCAPIALMIEPCNKVEMAVTKRFSTGLGNSYRTFVAGDLDIVEWRVGPDAQDDPTANFGHCAQNTDGGVP